jgi:hypothetical protein
VKPVGQPFGLDCLITGSVHRRRAQLLQRDASCKAGGTAASVCTREVAFESDVDGSDAELQIAKDRFQVRLEKALITTGRIRLSARWRRLLACALLAHKR